MPQPIRIGVLGAARVTQQALYAPARHVPGVAVTIAKAADRNWVKCARSWRYTDDVGSDREFPDVSARDAAALRELKALGRL